MKYQVIYCDPPWWYSNRSANRITKFGGGARAHYNVMTDSQLLDMQSVMNEIADDNSILFMWATCPRLDLAVKLIQRWGFRWVTVGFTWVKVTDDYVVSDDYRTAGRVTAMCGPGGYTSSNVELCLIGVRGSMPVDEKMIPQVTFHPVLRHSEKPQIFRDKIQRMYPTARKIEMFCRHAPEGWDTWGNEVGKLEKPTLLTA